MKSFVILGANSFLGKILISKIPDNFLIKAVARNIPINTDKCVKNISWIKLNTFSFSSLKNIFTNKDIIINLTYINNNNLEANTKLINNIVDACIHSEVSRLIHCSTANVVGDTDTKYINELTPCNPKTSYEKVKMEIEKIVLGGSSKGLDIAILRPTAIVGYEGHNLKKLSDSLIYGNKFINYLKRCFFGKMPLHLVPVNNVVSVLLNLSMQKNYFNGRVFIVSLDEDINNNFCDVEKILLNELGINNNKFPPIYVPRILQKILSKILNRSDLNPDRKYVSINLSKNNFEPTDNIKDAISQFALSIKKID